MKTTISSYRPPGPRARSLCPLALACILLLTVMGPFAPTAKAAVQEGATWADPNGSFTISWSAPWYPLRQEEQVIGLTDGLSILSIVESSPLPGIALTYCVQELASTAMGIDVTQDSFLEQHLSTWRAWATRQHAESGQTHYFECQVTPDGESVAFFVGGTPTALAAQGIPALEAFAGNAILKQQGERAPALASDGWRAGIIDWSRGKAFGDIGLPPASAGADLVVVVADLTNWQAASAELALDAFALESAGGDRRFPIDLDRSNLAAASLGEAGLESGFPIALQPGELRRITLVFSVDSSVGELDLRMGNTRIALEPAPGLEVLGALRPPAGAPAFQTGAVANVIDSRTLLVTLSETGQSERVRLIGVGAPRGIPAQQLLSSYVGQTILLERDPAHPDDQRLQRYVWVSDASGAPVMLNDLLVEQGLAAHESSATGGRFDAMIATAGGVVASGAGIEDQVPVLTVDPDTLPSTVPTEAEMAYLTELARYRDSIRLSLEYYDRFMADPTMDAEFFGHLGITVLGWAVFYDGIVQLQPPIRFGGLHDRLITAFEPFDLLAHQIEPELDLILSGGTPQQQFSGFDYSAMTQTVDAARPELEAVLAMIDAELARAGITSEGLATQ